MRHWPDSRNVQRRTSMAARLELVPLAYASGARKMGRANRSDFPSRGRGCSAQNIGVASGARWALLGETAGGTRHSGASGSPQQRKE